MQTFSDFITQRFGLSEFVDRNQQKVPDKMEKRIQSLKLIVNMILINPNYYKEFFQVVEEFVNDIKDNELAQRIEDLKQNNLQDEENKGLAQEEGILDKPNNLPPNMEN